MNTTQDKNGNSWKEKRKYPRAFFSTKEKVTGALRLPGFNKGLIITASLLNISEGGLCLAMKKDKDIVIKKGDRCIIDRIKTGLPGLDFNGIEIIVRWIMNNDFFEYLQIGCEMIKPDDSLCMNIRRIVDDRIDEPV